MINRLTGKKLEDSYITSKDGKSFIFDIRRPSAVSNIVTYDEVDASFNGLETRTGLGNRVLRRVNFIKPTIKPRTIAEGKLMLSQKTKTLAEMIKEGMKIKYEEPDPWDTKWLDEKDRIIKKMRDEGASEKTIDETLARYPPLNRKQRTRPVSRNPLEDANKPIKEQLNQLGVNVQGVTAQVATNAAEASTRAVKQLTDKQAMEKWTVDQMAKLQGIIKNVNTDNVAGQNLLQAKLQDVVQHMTLQQATLNNILMASMTRANIDTTLFDRANITEFSTPEIKMTVLKLLGEYYLNRGTLYENIENYMIAPTETYTVSFLIGTGMMKRDTSIYLVNNKIDKRIDFEYTDIPQPQLSQAEQDAYKLTDLSSIVGGIPDEITEYNPINRGVPINSGVPINRGVPIPKTVPIPLPMYTEDVILKIKEDNIERIITTIQEGLITIGENDVYRDKTTALLKPGIIQASDMRVLEVNIDYDIDKDFLSMSIPDPIIAKEVKKGGLFNPSYKKGDKVVYIPYPAFMAKQVSSGKNTQWMILKKFINDDLIEQRKNQANEYKRQANESVISAYNTSIKSSATDAKTSAKVAKTSAVFASKYVQDAVAKIEQLIKNNENQIKIQREAENLAMVLLQRQSALANMNLPPQSQEMVDNIGDDLDNMVNESSASVDVNKLIDKAVSINDHLSDVSSIVSEHLSPEDEEHMENYLLSQKFADNDDIIIDMIESSNSTSFDATWILNKAIQLALNLPSNKTILDSNTGIYTGIDDTTQIMIFDDSIKLVNYDNLNRYIESGDTPLFRLSELITVDKMSSFYAFAVNNVIGKEYAFASDINGAQARIIDNIQKKAGFDLDSDALSTYDLNNIDSDTLYSPMDNSSQSSKSSAVNMSTKSPYPNDDNIYETDEKSIGSIDEGTRLENLLLAIGDDGESKWKGLLKLGSSIRIVVITITDGKYVMVSNETQKQYDKNYKYQTKDDDRWDNNEGIVEVVMKDGVEYYITGLAGLTPKKQTDFMKYLNNYTPSAGSGIRGYHKKNINPLYKNSMENTKGKGLKLAGRGRKENPWLAHVKKFRASHPNLKYSDVLKQAKSTYKK
jgi:hypothetical protein